MLALCAWDDRESRALADLYGGDNASDASDYGCRWITATFEPRNEKLGAVHQVGMVVGVFISAVRTLEFSFRENGLLRQIITLRALVGNHRVSELGIAVVAFQDPFGHKVRPYPSRNLLKIQENIYLPLVLSERYRTKRTAKKGLENCVFRAVYFRKSSRVPGSEGVTYGSG
jgi:hypothetical protein